MTTYIDPMTKALLGLVICLAVIFAMGLCVARYEKRKRGAGED